MNKEKALEELREIIFQASVLYYMNNKQVINQNNLNYKDIKDFLFQYPNFLEMINEDVL